MATDMIFKKPLTDEQLNVILPILIKVLNKTSPIKTITADKIVTGMNKIRIEDGRFKSVFTEILLRKLANYIRTNGILPLIADHKGYYLSDDIRDIDAQIQSLQDRIAGMNNAIHGLKNYKSQLLFKAESIDPFGIEDWL
jgi:hypothetical protein